MEYPVEENPFESLGVDLTYRCNMSCTFCYNPIRSLADMDLSYFEEVCHRLPSYVHFKFLGGEPTLHPDFMDLIRVARRRKHEVTVLSNGRRYTEPDFVRALADLDARFILGLSLDGGASRDDVYSRINNEHCLRWKMKALETLDQHFPGRVEISAIIVRGLNEEVVPELLELAGRHRQIVRYIHFRTAAKAGRWGETAPYTLEELKEVVRPHFTEEQFRPQCLWETHCVPGHGCGACYRFRPTPRLQISLVEFATPRAASCPKRGKLVGRQFLVQSFFENIRHNSETLMEVMLDGKRVLMFGSNSYMGLTDHPKVKDAAQAAIRKYGTGCAGSRSRHSPGLRREAGSVCEKRRSPSLFHRPLGQPGRDFVSRGP